MKEADDYPQCVFNTVANVAEQPLGSRFFLGETVMHTGNRQLYTVCDLSNFPDDYYGLWPVGYRCAVPTHGAYGGYLEPIAEVVQPLQLN